MSTTEGRGLIASRVIDKSAVVIKERPYLAFLTKQEETNYCHNCFKKVGARFFPCRQCTAVRYCSNTCSQEAWTAYHERECEFYDIYRYLGFGKIALRIWFKVGEQAILRAATFADKVSTNETVQNDFSSFIRLTGHSEQLAFDLYSYAFGACVITSLLEKLNLVAFDAGDDDAKRRDIADILLKTLLIVNTNSARIYEESEGNMLEAFIPVAGHPIGASIVSVWP